MILLLQILSTITYLTEQRPELRGALFPDYFLLDFFSYFKIMSMLIKSYQPRHISEMSSPSLTMINHLVLLLPLFKKGANAVKFTLMKAVISVILRKMEQWEIDFYLWVPPFMLWFIEQCICTRHQSGQSAVVHNTKYQT